MVSAHAHDTITMWTASQFAGFSFRSTVVVVSLVPLSFLLSSLFFALYLHKKTSNGKCTRMDKVHYSVLSIGSTFSALTLIERDLFCVVFFFCCSHDMILFVYSTLSISTQPDILLSFSCIIFQRSHGGAGTSSISLFVELNFLKNFVTFSLERCCVEFFFGNIYF